MGDDVSGRFPFINLERALARAEALFAGDKSGKPMAVTTAFELWNYSPKSSGGFQTIAALKHYGLLEDEGANAERRVRLTAEARRYFLDERDDERQAMIAKFALSPPLFDALWRKDKWSEGIPADPVARSHLKIVRRLNDQSARSALSIFKENVHFSGLGGGPVAGGDVRSNPNPRADQPSGEMEEAFMYNQMGSRAAAVAPSPQVAQPKPIVFDMETLKVSATFDNADDLQDFLDKLERLKPLMPPRKQ